MDVEEGEKVEGRGEGEREGEAQTEVGREEERRNEGGKENGEGETTVRESHYPSAEVTRSFSN